MFYLIFHTALFKKIILTPFFDPPSKLYNPAVFDCPLDSHQLAVLPGIRIFFATGERARTPAHKFSPSHRRRRPCRCSPAAVDPHRTTPATFGPHFKTTTSFFAQLFSRFSIFPRFGQELNLAAKFGKEFRFFPCALEFFFTADIHAECSF